MLLHDLPSELIAHIVRHLNNEDIFALRQASKCIESSSLPVFGRRLFRKKGFMVTTESLHTLRLIAQHEKLSRYVEHIWLNPDCFTHVDVQEYCPPGPRSNARREALKRYVCDHDFLLRYPDILTKELAASLAKLPRVAVLGMRRSEDHRPWGWRTMLKATDLDPRVVGRPSYHYPVRSDATILYVAMLQAAAKAKITLRRLYTDAIEIDAPQALKLSQQTLDVACKELLYLEINLRRETGRDESVSEAAQPGQGLLQLLGAAPKLRELGLQIFEPTLVARKSWLQNYPHLALKHAVDSVKLKYLTRVKLEKISTSPAVLKGLLETSQSSLTSLKLRDIRLISSSDDIEYSRPWQTIFIFLRSCCWSLSYLLLYHLMHEHGGVSFVENPPRSVPYLEIDDPSNNPNQPFFGHVTGDDFFIQYDHLALEAKDRANVELKLAKILDAHWYHVPIFSYAMDEGVWHTDTSDEEW